MSTVWTPGKPISMWRRFAAANGMLVLSFCCLFVAALAAAVVFAREPSPVAGGQGLAGAGGIAGAGTRSRGGLFIGIDANDPVAHFAETRIGHIVFSQASDDNCRRVLFDNRTGASGDAGSVVCHYLAPEAAAMPTDRLQVLRKTFQR